MKEYVKKYGVVAFVVIMVIVSFVVYEKPVEQNIDAYTAASTTETETSEFIYIDIKGEVKNPGVYRVKNGTRLFTVIELAGGMTLDANNKLVNLSQVLRDEDMVVVPSVFDIVIYNEVDNPTSNPSDSLININRASLEQLEELPGIGPSTAQKIIDYRNDIGEFNLIEDIMNVPGIGEATFENIRELITV